MKGVTVMYSVFVHTKPLKKKLTAAEEAIITQLQTLQPGTEINVHTKKQTYYNAMFQSFHPKTGLVTLVTDTFYPDGAKRITVPVGTITSLHTPSSAQSDEEEE